MNISLLDIWLDTVWRPRDRDFDFAHMPQAKRPVSLTSEMDVPNLWKKSWKNLLESSNWHLLQAEFPAVNHHTVGTSKSALLTKLLLLRGQAERLLDFFPVETWSIIIDHRPRNQGLVWSSWISRISRVPSKKLLRKWSWPKLKY